MYEHILIPTDGSVGAHRGIEHGLDLAAKYGATVHTIYVLDERIYGATPALSADELALEKVEESAHEVMAEIVEAAEDLGLETRTRCVRGIPDEAIIDYAEANDIDLIVMGIHGTARVGRPHIGSVTDRVIRLTEIPVLPV